MQPGSEWAPLVVETLSAEGIDALLSRAVPFVHVPHFLDPAWCEEVVRRFHAALVDLPDHRSLVMGPALLDALARPVEMFVDDSNRDAYFSHVAGDAIRVRKLFVGGEDPLEKMRRTWRDAGWTEVPAAEDGDRRYHPDAVWGLREAAASPHVDAYECYRQLALSRFKRHLNYNVYLQDAQSGGAFAVYNRYAADPRSEGGAFVAVLDPAALTDNQRIEHRPAPGDLVIFDALLYHEVTPVDGRERARIQEHSNVLVDPATREVLFFA